MPEFAMPGPVCLIENTPEGELRVRQEALQILSDVTQPVVVVAIVGLYRTGKSYLMNKLAGKNKGFSLGSTIRSHTKGIWMWCVPHPQKPNHTLVLLDTEGLGDVEKGDSNNDSWIFALAVLLSSGFVYNSMGTIDQRALDQLHYVTELTKHIQVKSSKGKDPGDKGADWADFMSFFPMFVWAVRDFTLELELEGRAITADEYLENGLQLIQGNSPRVKQLNQPRECIRFYFPGRKCFVFDRPAGKKKLRKLEELEEEDLDEDFVEQTKAFCKYIFRECKTKTVQGGHPMTGNMLANLAVTFVDAIRSGGVPCIENTVLALAQIENSAAIQEAVSHYEKQMKERGQFPTATIKQFLDLHADCEREAIKIFMERSFKDEDQEFQEQLGGLLKVKGEQFCQQNEQVSTDQCTALLQTLFAPMDTKISEGFYSKPGGYVLFVESQKEITGKYHSTPGKGVKAEEVLREFLQAKESVATSILQMDQNLSEKEKEIAVEQAKAKAAEQEMKLKEEMHTAAQEKLEAQQRSHQEHVEQLTQKMEEEMRRQQQESEGVMTQKLKEQAALLQEGARQQHEQMGEQIRQLQQSMANASRRRRRCVVM